MSQFKEYKNLNLIDVAENVAEFWKQNKTFNKSVEIRQGKSRDLFFMKGPPSANGMPGIHHVMARALKDIFCRYQTPKRKAGFPVKAGPWDTAWSFLWKNWVVEKELGESQKKILAKKLSIEGLITKPLS